MARKSRNERDTRSEQQYGSRQVELIVKNAVLRTRFMTAAVTAFVVGVTFLWTPIIHSLLGFSAAGNPAAPKAEQETKAADAENKPTLNFQARFGKKASVVINARGQDAAGLDIQSVSARYPTFADIPRELLATGSGMTPRDQVQCTQTLRYIYSVVGKNDPLVNWLAGCKYRRMVVDIWVGEGESASKLETTATPEGLAFSADLFARDQHALAAYLFMTDVFIRHDGRFDSYWAGTLEMTECLDLEADAAVYALEFLKKCQGFENENERWQRDVEEAIRIATRSLENGRKMITKLDEKKE